MVVTSWLGEMTEQQLKGHFASKTVLEGFIHSLKQIDVPVMKDVPVAIDTTQDRAPAESVTEAASAPTEGNIAVLEQLEKTVVHEKQWVFQIAFKDGSIGYCPTRYFRQNEFSLRTYEDYVGRKESFVINLIDFNNERIYLSGIDALKKLNEHFWNRFMQLSEEERLTKEFDVVVTGVNSTRGIIYGLVEGQETFMYRDDWDWTFGAVEAQTGETIKVKVVKYDEKQQLLHVSRKVTLPDPFLAMKQYKEGDIIAGIVTSIHPEHGIFVKVENDVELIGSMPRSLETPIVGDKVSCRIRSLNISKRKGRVLITGYPEGKKRPKGISSFLYD